MKKVISQDLSLYTTGRYPFVNKNFSKLKNQVVIGIGGNVGNTKTIFDKLFLHLSQNSHFQIQRTSPILQNPPFGFLEQNDFLNGIIVLKTNLDAHSCLKIFQRYEKRFKRKRSFKDAPRTLDIDIIFFNDQRINSENLIVPHPHYQERISVLLPLQFVLSV